MFIVQYMLQKKYHEGSRSLRCEEAVESRADALPLTPRALDVSAATHNVNGLSSTGSASLS